MLIKHKSHFARHFRGKAKTMFRKSKIAVNGDIQRLKADASKAGRIDMIRPQPHLEP